MQDSDTDSVGLPTYAPPTTAAMPAVLYVKLPNESSHLSFLQALPIKISSPSSKPHPLELEVEKAKNKILAKRQMMNQTCYVTETVEERYLQDNNQLSSSLITKDVLMPLCNYVHPPGDDTPSCFGASNSNNDDGDAAQPQQHGQDCSNSEPPPTLHDEPDPDLPATVEKPGELSCHLCCKRFQHRKNMYAHLRGVHSCEPVPKGSETSGSVGIVCPLCRMAFHRHLHLRQHFLTLHQIQMPQLDFTFSSFTEFEAWKESTERETLSHFISKCAAQTLALNQNKRYFKCHRSGRLPSSSNRPNNSSKTSCKIGATCPAGMEVTEASDGICVTYWPKHVGHETREIPPSETQARLSEHGARVASNDQPESESGASRQGRRSRSRARAKSKPPRRNTSYALMVDKAHHLLELLEKGDVEPESRTLISKMIDNVRSVVMKRYRKHTTAVPHTIL